MKVARPTATSVHQRLGISPAPLTTACTPNMYCDHVRCSRTAFLYVVQHWLSMACTAYSCQVMNTTQQNEAPARDADRTRLSKAAVVERALALADTQGVDALTIRKL